MNAPEKVKTNMDIWQQVSRPPANRLKAITGGRLKGMTDVNPQWRIEVLTQVFGPCGFGWKYTIDRLWSEAGPQNDAMAFAQVSLYVKHEDEWSDAIHGIGGSALIAREKDGPRANDEAYKMAVTDALSVAMKAIGVAADIYFGLWDGSKYKEPQQQIGNGPIHPREECYKALDEEQRLALQEIALSAMSIYDKTKDLGKVSDYYRKTEFHGEKLTADEIAGLWFLFASAKTDKGKSFTAALDKWEAENKVNEIINTP